MTDPLSRLRRLLLELKRRKVYRVAAGYLVAAFVVLQLAGLAADAFGFPGWFQPMIWVVAGLGFPLAIVLAWAFEVTPEGVRRTPEAEPVEETEAAEAGTRTGYQVLLGMGLVAGAVAGGWYLMGGGGGEPAEVTEQTVAVFPFQVSGPRTEDWREGMITMVGTGLDGAAGVRAIPDQTVLAAWEQAEESAGGSGDPQFLNAARRIGSRYAVVGQAAKLGGELRLSADVYETTSGDRLNQVEVRGSPDRFTSLTDSLTRQVLGVLLEESGQDLPSVNLPSLTTSSLPALKSFLRGERHYRAGEYEAAMNNYEAAVEQDSSFALAYARVSMARGWALEGGTLPPLRRAYALSDRLPSRERRLVQARYVRRMQGHPLAAADSLRRLTEEYPDDPSIWYFLGETVFHGSVPAGWAEAETAFEEAVKLDPGIAPYHHHLVGLAMSLHHDSALAARRLEAHPEGPTKTWLQTLWDLNFGSRERQAAAWTRMDTITVWHGVWAHLPLSHPTDVALRERVLEALLGRVEETGFYFGTTRLRGGKSDEALTPYPDLSKRASALFGCYVAGSLTLGYPLPDSIVRFRGDPPSVTEDDGYSAARKLRCAGLSLIAQDRAEELGPVLQRLRGIPERPDPPAGIERRIDHAVRSLKGYRALSAGDLNEAAKHWAGFNDFAGPAGSILRGDLHRKLGRREQAEDWYRAAWLHPVAHERLGQLYEETGEPEKAAAAYRRFIAAWEDADPELQPRVEAARKRLKELTPSGAETND